MSNANSRGTQDLSADTIGTMCEGLNAAYHELKDVQNQMGKLGEESVQCEYKTLNKYIKGVQKYSASVVKKWKQHKIENDLVVSDSPEDAPGIS